MNIGTLELKEKIALLEKLGAYIEALPPELEKAIHQSYLHNKWFTPANTKAALAAIRENFLRREQLEPWLGHYDHDQVLAPRVIGLVLAGNIPMVGFHDLLCVFLSGHRALVKVSEKDRFLIPHLLEQLGSWDHRVKERFEIAGQLRNFDAVIATGSNNTARYFEAYFGKYPHVIRKNRNSVAVLTGEETEAELDALGQDIFQYFGLGCRNVSKLYVPEGYDFQPLLSTLDNYVELVQHDKYKNNYDYTYTLLLLNKRPHLTSKAVLLEEQESLQSRIAALHYEFYSGAADLGIKLENKKEEIQCVVSGRHLPGIRTFPFGQAQHPGLGDYADGLDTMDFLLHL